MSTLRSSLEAAQERMARRDENGFEIVVVSQKAFDELNDYSCSFPSGTTIGKRWKRHEPYQMGPGIEHKWYMGEYIEDPHPKMVGIKWRRLMRTKEVCEKCGAPIDKARQTLELTTCEACAKEIPGNLLRNEDRSVQILDATLDAMSPKDMGNAAPTGSADKRSVRCIKCGAYFNLHETHVCRT